MNISLVSHADEKQIAIVGIGCRFPGHANGVTQLWQSLLNGVDGISEIPPTRWNIASFFHPQKGIAGKSATRWGGFIEAIDQFDAEFFAISPREAKVMDPQQRLLLEVCWESLEDAGCVPSQWQGRPVGVFVGGFTLDYMLMQLGGGEYRNVEPHTATGSMMTLLANRLSYVFGFQGPSLAVDTACSSSLVAIHLACRSLLDGESEMAIAGGVNALLGPSYTIAESRAGMLSPTGRSRAFDARADGYVRGEGVGLVVLKTLARAQADGDQIYALIRATAVNQDGSSDGLTVPSGDAQQRLMTEALTKAQVTPAQLSYVEAHGTGTPVGDPIEANAIGSITRQGRASDNPCLLGSIKTNIGHTEAAAGVAGLIKAALVLQQRCVPPHLHFQSANPKIDFAALGLHIPSQVTPLAETGTLYAAVNSFGFGGTNAHAILSSVAPPAAAGNTDSCPPPAAWILPISARHPALLAQSAAAWAAMFTQLEPGEGESTKALRDICHSAATRREQHPYRAAVVGQSAAELAEGLQHLSQGESHPALFVSPEGGANRHGLCFVYTGMGPQWWGMGQGLYAREPVFAASVDRCCQLFEAIAGWSLFDAMFNQAASARMAETEVAQPANFVLQVALTDLLAAWGIRPEAIVGHSAGEPAAAYAAGVLSLAEAVQVIYVRSSLQQTTTGQGRLMAVGLAPAALQAELALLQQPSLSLAAINSPTSVTVVGDDQAISQLKQHLDQHAVFARELRVSVPYHSVFMAPLEAAVLEQLAGLQPQAAHTPLYSTVTGQPVMGSELDAVYWYQNIRQSVEFLAASQAIAQSGLSDFVEIGPHPVLGASLKETFAALGRTLSVTATLRRETDEARQLRDNLAQLHVLGYSPDWPALQGAGQYTRLPLPVWKSTRLWHEPPQAERARLQAPEHPLLARRLDLATPVWEVDLESAALDFLPDHQIQGSVVFPGTGYIEMALHAASTLYGSLRVVDFQQISFISALYIIPENPVTLRLSVEPASHCFTIQSKPYHDLDAAWQTHCTGQFCLSQITQTAPIDLETLQQACPREISKLACYQHFRALGLEYGETFQGIAQLWQGDNQAVALLEVPAVLQHKLADFHAHPAVLDVCFQVLAATLPIKQSGNLVYMPTQVAHGRRYGALSHRLWIVAQLTHQDEQGLCGDIVMYNDAGEKVFDIHQCQARAMGGEREANGRVVAEQHLYRPAWVVQPLEEIAALASGEGGTWLLYGEAGEQCDALAQALSQQGQQVICVTDQGEILGLTEEGNAQGNPGSWDATQKPAWIGLLNQVSAQYRLRGVVHLGASTPALSQASASGWDSEELQQVVGARCLTVLALTQALAELELATEPRLWIVTRGTQPVAEQAVSHPFDAAVWGLGRVLGHGEHIRLWGGMIDLPTQPSADEGRQIVADLLSSSGEDQIAWRDQQRYVMRLEQCDTRSAGISPPALRRNASYLITGGLGALGLVIAAWLVERGARHLILVGREGLPARAQWNAATVSDSQRKKIAAVQALEAAGCRVQVEALDISELSQVTALVSTYEAAGYPPIRGVIHSAGVATPQLLSQMTAQDFMSVMPAKVEGAWCLHQAFSHSSLDFFVLFSSVASLVISMGQSNYAAANAALDALAHWRRGQGLPALSVNWGPWGDVGMVIELDLLKHFYQRGFIAMTSQQGTQALGQLLSSDREQAIVLGAQWQRITDTSPLGIPAPLLLTVLAEEQRQQQQARHAASGETVQDFTQAYRACASADDQQVLVVSQLKQLVSQVLRIEMAALTEDRTLTQLGMDSMMAIELKNRIERTLKVNIAIVDLLKGASIDSIAALLATEIALVHGVVDDELADILGELRELGITNANTLFSDAN
ncbi:type I polyketide synthase [Serratia microhaemolytica]|uniref:type I polyketide synthase n=1 Tax=Serratia microhaemolytica TaxID=2675110 RepID=UPI000FDF29CD|nr:type I polyketide synthase [Serratia microhaemolytica]